MRFYFIYQMSTFFSKRTFLVLKALLDPLNAIPNMPSISYTLFFAHVLFKLLAAHEKKGYQEVINKCEHALGMEYSVD
jgi:hypothetical protein